VLGKSSRVNGNTLKGMRIRGARVHIPSILPLSAQISDRTRRAALQKTIQFLFKNWLEGLILLDSFEKKLDSVFHMFCIVADR
jgi:hypothetical protein